MKYIELKIYTSEFGIEPVTALLMEKGITGAVVNNPKEIQALLNDKEQHQWDYVDPSVALDADNEPTVTVYFDDTDEGRRQIQEVKLAVMMLKSKEMEGIFGWDVSLGRLYAEDSLVDEDKWKDKWKEYFRTTKVTDRLVIKPTWEQYEAAPDELVIELDPGMAFGTGTHETTVLCMEFLEKYLKKDQKVLDAGCGSGILSIAADLLGSSEVLAVDIDPDAVMVAKENVKSDRITVVEGDLTKGLDFQADIVVANLTADLLAILAPAIGQHLMPSGIFISSGILTEKKEDTAEAFKKAGLKILEIVDKGEWCAIAAAQ